MKSPKEIELRIRELQAQKAQTEMELAEKMKDKPSNEISLMAYGKTFMQQCEINILNWVLTD